MFEGKGKPLMKSLRPMADKPEAYSSKPGFCMHKRVSAGNLDLSLSGEFNGMCAWELLKIIKRSGSISGRVFVDTSGLEKVLSSGVSLFKSHMARKPLPQDWLYFKGRKGFQIAPKGSRVLMFNKCGRPKALNSKRDDQSLPPADGKLSLKSIDVTKMGQ